MNYKQLLHELIGAQDDLLKTVDSFPDTKRQEKLFDNWTLQEVLGHISGWNLLRINEIEQLVSGQEVKQTKDFDAYNKQFLEERTHLTWEEVYDELVTSCYDLIDAYTNIPEVLLNKAIWVDSDRTVKDWLEIDLDHWINEHLQHIKKYAKRNN